MFVFISFKTGKNKLSSGKSFIHPVADLKSNEIYKIKKKYSRGANHKYPQYLFKINVKLFFFLNNRLFSHLCSGVRQIKSPTDLVARLKITLFKL